MRKLLALFVMLAVLGVCAPSYGYILVYKITIKGKAVNTYNDEIVGAKIPAFWVVDINETADSADITESSLVLYGKVDGSEKYARVDSEDVDAVLLMVGETGPDDWDIAVVTMEPPSCSVSMFGKLKATNIGLSEKKWIPTSFTGGILLNGDFFGYVNLMGSGTVSAKVDSNLTTKANVDAAGVSVVVDNIISALENKGYQPL